MPLPSYEQSAPYLPKKLRKIIAQIRKHGFLFPKITNISKTVDLYIFSDMSSQLHDQTAP